MKKECPFCGGKIPKEKIKEFESKVQEGRAKIEKDYEAKFKKREEEWKKDFNKILSDRDKLYNKNMKDTEEFYKKTEQEKLERMKAEIISEADNKISSKNKQIEELTKERNELQENTDSVIKQKLADKNREIDKIKQEKQLETERLQRLNEELTRQLEAKTSERLGSIGQKEVLDILRREFRDDEIKETKSGKLGSDIFQRVFYNNEECGLIIYEVKNVSIWSNNFIKQVNKQKTLHNTPHCLLVSNVFPRGEKDLCIMEGVTIVHPTKLLPLAIQIRSHIIELHKIRASREDMDEKTKELYDYLGSNDYKQKLQNLFRKIEELKDLQNKDRVAHARIWDLQTRIHSELFGDLAKTSSRISTIMESKLEPVQIIEPKKKLAELKKKKKQNENNI